MSLLLLLGVLASDITKTFTDTKIVRFICAVSVSLFSVFIVEKYFGHVFGIVSIDDKTLFQMVVVLLFSFSMIIKNKYIFCLSFLCFVAMFISDLFIIKLLVLFTYFGIRKDQNILQYYILMIMILLNFLQSNSNIDLDINTFNNLLIVALVISVMVKFKESDKQDHNYFFIFISCVLLYSHTQVMFLTSNYSMSFVGLLLTYFISYKIPAKRRVLLGVSVIYIFAISKQMESFVIIPLFGLVLVSFYTSNGDFKFLNNTSDKYFRNLYITMFSLYIIIVVKYALGLDDGNTVSVIIIGFVSWLLFDFLRQLRISSPDNVSVIIGSLLSFLGIAAVVF